MRGVGNHTAALSGTGSGSLPAFVEAEWLVGNYLFLIFFPELGTGKAPTSVLCNHLAAVTQEGLQKNPAASSSMSFSSSSRQAGLLCAAALLCPTALQPSPLGLTEMGQQFLHESPVWGTARMFRGEQEAQG